MKEKNYFIQKQLDARGLLCPEPVMLLHKVVRSVNVGEYIEIIATDPSTQRDIPKFCEFLGHSLEKEEVEEGEYKYHIRKGGDKL